VKKNGFYIRKCEKNFTKNHLPDPRDKTRISGIETSENLETPRSVIGCKCTLYLIHNILYIFINLLYKIKYHIIIYNDTVDYKINMICL
jgi:hypothetical protein